MSPLGYLPEPTNRNVGYSRLAEAKLSGYSILQKYPQICPFCRFRWVVFLVEFNTLAAPARLTRKNPAPYP